MATARKQLVPEVNREVAADALIARLQHFVSVPSVNPGTSETAMARAVAASLHDVPGVSLHEVETFPGRMSLAVVLAAKKAGPRLVINGHLDTVPEGDTDLWSMPPFAGRVHGGYLWGRGACDMKAGLVAQIAALRALAALGGPKQGALVLHFAVGEERAEPGTRSLIDAGFSGDVGIVTEPTSLRVATAARGMAAFRVVIHGQGAHGSSPTDVDNPIFAVPDVLACVERYASRRRGSHPLLSSGSCTPTMVHAGELRNATPQTCELTFDRRLVPGQDVSEELTELERALDLAIRRHPDLRFEVGCDPLGFTAAEIPTDSPFAELVNSARRTVTGKEAAIVGTSFSSDIHVLVNDAGMEAVTFGPGDISHCHAIDERVSIRQLQAAAQTLFLVAAQLLG